MTKQALARERTLAAIKKHSNDPGKIALELGVAYDEVLAALRQYQRGRHVVAIGSNEANRKPTIACPVCSVTFWASSVKDTEAKGRYRRSRVDETGCPHCRKQRAEELRAALRRHFKRGTPHEKIAKEFNVSKNQVHHAYQEYKKRGSVQALGLRKPGNIPTCATCDCGKEKSPQAVECIDCSLDRRRKENAVLAAPKREAIMELAWELGHIPSSSEAAERLKCARDTANKHIQVIFGPDPRSGYQTRTRRPLPDWMKP